MTKVHGQLVSTIANYLELSTGLERPTGFCNPLFGDDCSRFAGIHYPLSLGCFPVTPKDLFQCYSSSSEPRKARGGRSMGYRLLRRFDIRISERQDNFFYLLRVGNAVSLSFRVFARPATLWSTPISWNRAEPFALSARSANDKYHPRLNDLCFRSLCGSMKRVPIALDLS